jgi:hypothetical protein
MFALKFTKIFTFILAKVNISSWLCKTTFFYFISCVIMYFCLSTLISALISWFYVRIIKILSIKNDSSSLLNLKEESPLILEASQLEKLSFFHDLVLNPKLRKYCLHIFRTMRYLRSLVDRHETTQGKGHTCPFMKQILKSSEFKIVFDDQVRDYSTLLAVMIKNVQEFIEIKDKVHTRHVCMFVYTKVPGFMIEAAQKQLKLLCVKNGLMIGDFHPYSALPAIAHPDVFLSQSPYPCLALRLMTKVDLAFLSEDLHLDHYMTYFGKVVAEGKNVNFNSVTLDKLKSFVKVQKVTVLSPWLSIKHMFLKQWTFLIEYLMNILFRKDEALSVEIPPMLKELESGPSGVDFHFQENRSSYRPLVSHTTSQKAVGSLVHPESNLPETNSSLTGLLQDPEFIESKGSQNPEEFIESESQGAELNTVPTATVAPSRNLVREAPGFVINLIKKIVCCVHKNLTKINSF